MNGYRIPSQTRRTESRVVNSRFVCTLGRADTAIAARAFVDAVKLELADASSTAFAFCAGHGSSVTHGCSDGGEPKGTAGQPMLAVLRGSDLGDVVAVVSRYFGGTKLGTGGLVRSFGDAVRDGLLGLVVEERIERVMLSLQLAYPDYERMLRLMRDQHAELINEAFAEHVTLTLRFAVADVAGAERALRDAAAGRLHFTRTIAV